MRAVPVALLAALLVATLVLAGCSGSDGSSGASGSSPAVPGPAITDLDTGAVGVASAVAPPPGAEQAASPSPATGVTAAPRRTVRRLAEGRAAGIGAPGGVGWGRVGSQRHVGPVAVARYLGGSSRFGAGRGAGAS